MWAEFLCPTLSFITSSAIAKIDIAASGSPAQYDRWTFLKLLSSYLLGRSLPQGARKCLCTVQAYYWLLAPFVSGFEEVLLISHTLCHTFHQGNVMFDPYPLVFVPSTSLARVLRSVGSGGSKLDPSCWWVADTFDHPT